RRSSWTAASRRDGRGARTKRWARRYASCWGSRAARARSRTPRPPARTRTNSDSALLTRAPRRPGPARRNGGASLASDAQKASCLSRVDTSARLFHTPLHCPAPARCSAENPCRRGDPMRPAEPNTTPHATSRRMFLRLALASGGAAAVSLSARPALAQQAPASKAGETPKKGGTLRVGFYVEPARMDPHRSGSKIARQVYHKIYEPLLVLDTNLGIKPGLAESWQQPDPKTLILKLRRGVKFHDGTDLDAEAVKFNFNRM